MFKSWHRGCSWHCKVWSLNPLTRSSLRYTQKFWRKALVMACKVKAEQFILFTDRCMGLQAELCQLFDSGGTIIWGERLTTDRSSSAQLTNSTLSTKAASLGTSRSCSNSTSTRSSTIPAARAMAEKLHNKASLTRHKTYLVNQPHRKKKKISHTPRSTVWELTPLWCFQPVTVKRN